MDTFLNRALHSAKSGLAQNKHNVLAKGQKGFTLVELIVVLAIVAIIALLGVPAIQNYFVEGRVETSANDINKVAAKVRGNFASNGANPYASMDSGIFAKTARGLVTAGTVNGTSTLSISLELGSTGGSITAAPVSSGAGFSVTVGTAAEASCPGLVSILSRSADSISVNGTSAKASGGTYNAATAQDACTSGDTNSYVIGFK